MNTSDVKALDQADPLRNCRDLFDLPEGIIYLDGNSLGALPKSVSPRLDEVQDQWRQSLIKSWNIHDWYGLPALVGEKIGRLIGAEIGTVVCADSTSINLYKLLTAALLLNPGRKIILSDTGNFPTDLYVIQGLLGLLGDGYKLRLVAPEEVASALTDDIAVAVITEVDYRTGRKHNMAELNARAKSSEIKLIWDLCHSAGAFPVDLSGCGAELAIGCSYKYLNGGPGAPAYLYVAQELQESIRPPLSGWMGHAAPFEFDLDYLPSKGITRNLCGTPAVIAMSALNAALDIWDEIDLQDVREKSQSMINLFADLIDELCPNAEFTHVTTFSEEQRGSQFSIAHPQGYAIVQALIDHGVIGDFRAPDILRFGMTPLYVSYSEILRAVETLADIMESGAWDQPKYHARGVVT